PVSVSPPDRPGTYAPPTRRPGALKAPAPDRRTGHRSRHRIRQRMEYVMPRTRAFAPCAAVALVVTVGPVGPIGLLGTATADSVRSGLSDAAVVKAAHQGDIIEIAGGRDAED